MYLVIFIQSNANQPNNSDVSDESAGISVITESVHLSTN